MLLSSLRLILFVNKGFFQSQFLQCMASRQTIRNDLLKFLDVTPAHKGLSLLGKNTRFLLLHEKKIVFLTFV